MTNICPHPRIQSGGFRIHRQVSAQADNVYSCANESLTANVEDLGWLGKNGSTKAHLKIADPLH